MKSAPPDRDSIEISITVTTTAASTWVTVVRVFRSHPRHRQGRDDDDLVVAFALHEGPNHNAHEQDHAHPSIGQEFVCAVFGVIYVQGHDLPGQVAPDEGHADIVRPGLVAQDACQCETGDHSRPETRQPDFGIVPEHQGRGLNPD